MKIKNKLQFLTGQPCRKSGNIHGLYTCAGKIGLGECKEKTEVKGTVK